jgi:hypothetical protein
VCSPTDSCFALTAFHMSLNLGVMARGDLQNGGLCEPATLNEESHLRQLSLTLSWVCVPVGGNT